jgi:hypothetical protein
MSLAEIKQAIKSLTPEERNELQAYMWAAGPHLPVMYSDTVEDRMAEMDAGKKIYWRDVKEDIIARETPDE